MKLEGQVPGSFRDPSGSVFWHQGGLYRTVTKVYEDEYAAARDAGLYEKLISKGLLVQHEEVELDLGQQENVVAVIKPEVVPFISYPYEWCFSQLKDAALATLKIQKIALGMGFTLKDSSAYNVQFVDGKPVFIDTLSFERYVEGEPWIAYKQFCQHFLAPLLLMSLTDISLAQLSRLHLDGVPLDLASKLLPKKTKFSPMIAMHIHLHAKTQTGTQPDDVRAKQARVSKVGLIGLIDNLASIVKKTDWTPAGTVWADYYNETNYSDDSMTAKKDAVRHALAQVSPEPNVVWDLGANNGEFARLATGQGINAVAWDIDPAAVEKNYRLSREKSDAKMLPLVQDLTNPSPAQGWAHSERESLRQRGPADALMALALIHHIAIGNNVPLDDVASFFSDLGKWLVVEFVPKEDSQVKRMLANRRDVFPNYHIEGFVSAFEPYFEIIERNAIPDTERTLFLMKSRKHQ